MSRAALQRLRRAGGVVTGATPPRGRGAQLGASLYGG